MSFHENYFYIDLHFKCARFKINQEKNVKGNKTWFLRETNFASKWCKIKKNDKFICQINLKERVGICNSN